MKQEQRNIKEISMCFLVKAGTTYFPCTTCKSNVQVALLILRDCIESLCNKHKQKYCLHYSGAGNSTTCNSEQHDMLMCNVIAVLVVYVTTNNNT